LDFLNTLSKKPKFIGVGTFAEYGATTLQVNETYPENPISLYGIAKLVLKQYSQKFCTENNMGWMWIRPCFIYGPHDVETRLIPSLIRKFSKNETVDLDECKTIIDLLYVDDFVNFVYNIIISKNEGTYNISSGESYHLKDVINNIHTLLGSKSIINFDPTKNRTTVQNYVCANNDKIKKDTNLNSTSLLTGLEKTIKFYNER
jgi:nucleoside-diphosphate-sugar epimerase